MNKILKWGITALLVGLVIFAAIKFVRRSSPFKTVEKDNHASVLAIYNRNTGTEVNSFSNAVHIIVRITPGSSNSVRDELTKFLPSASPCIITAETWPGMAEKFGKENILSLVANGKLDDEIHELAVAAGKNPQPVLVRFDPDMEVYVDAYPWQKQSSEGYAKAFNHFAEIIKRTAPAAKMVWSPAGYPGTEEYWPGAKWVDITAVTLKGKSEGMATGYPEAKDQQELIYRKLHRVRFFDKPVLVIGSQKIDTANFEQRAFDSAASYLRTNGDIVYKDVNAADNPIAPGLLRKDGALIAGAFDPSHSLVDSVSLTAEHLFVNIWALKSGEFKKKFDSILQRNRSIIVTMEPWKDDKVKKDHHLVNNILNGSYNRLFDSLYDVIGKTSNTIYLRFLHEMEIPITRYPWQSQDPVQYIKAYRYFVNYIRSKKPQHIYFVWGPAGDRGSMEFWPGTDVVDYTSIAIYGLPDKNITDHNQQESFNTIFKRKYRRIWFSQRPLFITEFGVKGPQDYKKQWLEGAAKTIGENKEINGVSYFNDTDSPKAWGDIEAPDWSISAQSMKYFLSLVNGTRK